MNIFVLHEDACGIARHYCDIHLRKMMVEYVQLLCNAMPEHLAPYKRTHYNHPCSKWVRESAQNWEWLNTLVWSMGWQYFNRFSVKHRSSIVREQICSWNPYNHLPNIKQTPWPQVMPEEFKCDWHLCPDWDYMEIYRDSAESSGCTCNPEFSNAVYAYRRYYAYKLRDFRKRKICVKTNILSKKCTTL